MNKRIISVLIAMILVIGTIIVAVPYGAASESTVLGDADGDGKLTILDATAIQRHLADLDPLDDAAIRRANVTGGKTLRILDATAIQRKLARLITLFPIEEIAEPTEPEVQPTDPAVEPTAAQEPTAEPTTPPAPVSTTRTIYVGVISFLANELGVDNFYVHYWGGKSAGDALLRQDPGKFEYKYVGYWTGENKMFVMFVTEIPADATGFKVHYNYDRWFGEDADAAVYNKAFIFNYDGDKAVYDHVYVEEPPTQEPTTPPAQEPTTAPEQPSDEVTKVKDKITIYFSNNKGWSKVNAYLYNYATGAAKTDWPGSAMTYVKTNNEGEKVYSVTVDVTKYDRIIFNNGTDQTTDTPITKASSGYFIDPEGKGKAYSGNYIAGVYPYGQDQEGNVTTVSMDYPDGYKKKVYIWTPVGYNAADKTKKYHVLYMCDGQNLFGQKTTLSGYEWECDETVLSMMKNGGDGVIVVGVEAGSPSSRRDHELTPNLGDTAPGVNTYGSFSDGGGKVFSDFVVDTVIPYVEANYNVSDVRGIAGSSSGGIEAFYIGMEHMDKFRFIGALSPAFILYTKATWDNYLKTKDFTGDVPRVYFFCGNSSQDMLEQQLYPNAVAMQGWLKALGYPSDKMITVTDDKAIHIEGFWALYFPEMLSWCMEL